MLRTENEHEMTGCLYRRTDFLFLIGDLFGKYKGEKI